jgi:hypothetical protein
METFDVHLVLATRPLVFVAANLSRKRSLIESDLTECLSGGFTVQIAGDFNAKHTDCNYGLTTARGSLLLANRNLCLIDWSEFVTTVPCTHNATTDVLDIVVIKDFVLPVHLTVCSALSSDHPLAPDDITCPPSFQNLLDLPDLTRMNWASFWACLEDRLPGNPVIRD